MILCMQQLTIYCLSPVIAYSAKMQLEPLNRFPLPAGTMLNIINKDHWRDTSGGRAFPFLVPACSSARASFFSTQLPPASPSDKTPAVFSSLQHPRGTSFPRLLPITGFPQYPLGYFQGGFLAVSIKCISNKFHQAIPLPFSEPSPCPFQQGPDFCPRRSLPCTLYLSPKNQSQLFPNLPHSFIKV